MTRALKEALRTEVRRQVLVQKLHRSGQRRAETYADVLQQAGFRKSTGWSPTGADEWEKKWQGYLLTVRRHNNGKWVGEASQTMGMGVGGPVSIGGPARNAQAAIVQAYKFAKKIAAKKDKDQGISYESVQETIKAKDLKWSYFNYMKNAKVAGFNLAVGQVDTGPQKGKWFAYATPQGNLSVKALGRDYPSEQAAFAAIDQHLAQNSSESVQEGTPANDTAKAMGYATDAIDDLYSSVKKLKQAAQLCKKLGQAPGPFQRHYKDAARLYDQAAGNAERVDDTIAHADTALREPNASFWG